MNAHEASMQGTCVDIQSHTDQNSVGANTSTVSAPFTGLKGIQNTQKASCLLLARGLVEVHSKSAGLHQLGQLVAPHLLGEPIGRHSLGLNPPHLGGGVFRWAVRV